MISLMVNENKNSVVFNLLLLLIPIYLGRIQEMIPFLENLHIAKIAMGMALLIFVMTIKSYSKANTALFKIPQVKYIIAIFVMALLSVPFSAWPGGSLDYIITSYSKLLLFVFLLVWCVNTENELNKLCWSFVVTVLIIDIAVFVNPNVTESTLRVFVSSTYDPNDIALLLVIAFPIMFYMMENNAGWKKLLLVVTMSMSLIVVLKTGSRGGLVALVAVLSMLSYNKGVGYVIKRLPIALILLFIALNNVSEAQKERLGTVFTMKEDYNATDRSGRVEIWKRGLSLMLNKPLFGCGINQFSIVNGKMPDGSWLTAHNSFIQIGAELGIISLMLFVMTIYMSIKTLNDCESNLENAWLIRGVRTALYGFCIGGFFLSWAYACGLYFLIALTVIINKIGTNKNKIFSTR